MKLKNKFLSYLIFLHVSGAGISVYFLWENRDNILFVELFLALTFSLGVFLLRKLFNPIESIQTGIDFIQSKDFSTRFIEVKQQELNGLIQLYNHMVDYLREERIELEEKNLFLNKLIQSSPSGIIIFDFDRKIISMNPASEKLLSLVFSEISGKQMNEIDHPLFEELQRLEDQQSEIITLQGFRKIRCQKSSFINKGFPQSFILIEELTEEFKQTEKKAYEKLIRMMSHEVNNTVGAVNSLLNSSLVYKSELSDDSLPDFQTALETAILRNNNLNAFMKSFADVIRIPSPVLRKYNLTDLLKNVANLFHKKLIESDIKIEWDLYSDEIFVLIDFNQIEQVIINIIKNAIEAIRSNGKIILRVSIVNSEAKLIIEDSGSGISDNMQKNLFVPFFTTKENGQGIGLTMIQEILSNHKLDFKLESKESGPTHFIIFFPLS